MALDLTSVDAKLRRADEHLKAIKGIIASGLTASNYAAVKEVNADATRYSIFLRVKQDLPFEDLSLLVGDCIHNFRSALDHLLYAVAVHESGTNPPPGETDLMFPITSAGKFEGSRWRIKTLSLDVQTAIETLQPDKRRHPEIPPALWLLRTYDDVDKHRLLHVVLASVHTGHLGTIVGIPIGRQYDIAFNMGSLKDGTEVVALIFDRPTPNVTYEWEGNLIVAMRHEKGPLGNVVTEVIALIELIAAEVRHVVAEVSKAVK